MKRLAGFLALAAVLGALTACATIASGSQQRINIRSTPDEATVKIYDSAGMVVLNSKTPTFALLKKGDGYFQKASYRILFEREGYKSQEVVLTATLNGGWYLLGNFFIGGLIGWLIVDPITGGMWTLSPKDVNVDMAKGTAFVPQDGSVVVVLRQQVPDQLAAVMRPVTEAN